MEDPTAAVPAADGGADSSLDSALDSLVTLPPSGNAAPATETGSSPSEPPAPEPAPAAEPEAAEEEELPADDEDALEKINARASSGQKEIRVDVNRWKRVYDGGYKEMQALRSAIPGITAEVARQNYEMASGFEQMQADFKSGTPEGIANVASFLANGIEGAPPESFALLAETATNTLREVNPEAYAGLQSQMLTPIVEDLYREAAKSNDPHMLYVAQSMDFKLNGRYRNAGDVPKQADPISEREQALERREQAIQQHTAQQRDNAWGEQFQTVNQGLTRVVSEATEAALQGVVKEFEAYPRTLGAIRRDIASGVREKIEGDRQFIDNLNRDLQLMRQSHNRAWSSGRRLDLSRDADALIAQYKTRADAFAAAVAKDIVNEASAKLKDNNDATHNKRAEAANKRAPVAGGAPTRKGIVNQDALAKARNVEEVLDSLLPTPSR